MHPLIDAMLGAMRHDAQRVERVGVNLANALTPGYQRELVVARPMGVAVAGPFARLVSMPAVDATDLAQRTDIARDPRPGTLTATAQPWHLALAGSGYFEVQTPAGPAYTRRGDFRLDAQGRLVTAQGWPVMGSGGEIRPGNEGATVEPSGLIRAGGRTVAQLKVVGFEGAPLSHLDAGYFTSEAPPVVQDELRTVVRSGHLENANVAQGREMVELMQAMRHFESLTRALQTYDDMLGGAVRRLGEN
jgi:flagellar basal-body rod protein FlgG